MNTRPPIDNAIITFFAALMLTGLFVLLILFAAWSLVTLEWNNPFDEPIERLAIMIFFIISYIAMWDK